MTAYLVELAIRLAQGVALLPEELVEKHARFFESFQRDDGGFVGREGDSDPYYTSFALRSIALLGRLEGDVADRAANYVNAQLDNVSGNVDFISTLFSASQLEATVGINLLVSRSDAWRDDVRTAWENLRRDDGSYAKTSESGSGSTYHTFLVVLAKQLLNEPLDDAELIAQFVQSRRRDDGGFVEIAAMRRSGTNPTAAALALLNIFDQLDDETRRRARIFLADMQSQEGGLTANTRIPVADLLSTFTGLLTLTDLYDSDHPATNIDLPAVLRYVRALEQPGGGFIGGVWDEEADVEYTFYGLGSLALLAAAGDNANVYVRACPDENSSSSFRQGKP
jgi:geranylgeranyl transferase type-2 subunit beta